MNYNEKFMKKAMQLAKKAYDLDEVPVGAVIVRDGKIVSFAYNQRESSNDATAHAEILAIKKACKKLKDFRLIGCDMYVTLEPCVMCTGAILNSRIENVYFGAYDMLNGAFGSKSDMKKIMNYEINSYGGIMEKECSSLLKEYFERLR